VVKLGTMINRIKKYWADNFGELPPKADELKFEFGDRWVRFHSLPESKRYANSESEYEQVLFRYNSLIKELFPYQSELFVVLTEYSNRSEPEHLEYKLLEIFPETEYWCSIQTNEEDDDPIYWHFHATKTGVEDSALNKLLRLVADDEISNVMLFCNESESLFHPYDGGSDCILSSVEHRNRLEGKFSNWLSAHPEGL